MTVATALISGNDSLPQLAEEAVQLALTKAGLTHANGVLLFLTPEFARHARHAQASVTAAARTAQCTQVAGGIASGVFTEYGESIDRPTAAVMVFGRTLSLGHPDTDAPTVLNYAGGTFPTEWIDSGKRFGGSFSGNFAGSAVSEGPIVWQQSRLTEQNFCEVQILGGKISLGVSCGLQLLGQPLRVERTNGFDLEVLDGMDARQSLKHCLPPTLRSRPELHLHHITAMLLEDKTTPENALSEGRYRPIAIIASNADNSLTLAERLVPGQSLAWAIREPLAAEADMRKTIDDLAQNNAAPSCALMFSCIGRGPYFYGGEDRDLKVLRERFPNLPVLGTYGTGQIAPASTTSQSGNRSLQNAVVTALINQRDGTESKPTLVTKNSTGGYSCNSHQ